MKFCPLCGEKRFPKANFCYECGFKFPLLSIQDKNQRLMENRLHSGNARKSALENGLKGLFEQKELVFHSRIKALKPCNSCSFSKKFHNGSCEIEEKHFLSTQCPTVTWEQKKRAMNVRGDLVLRIATCGQREDGVYQDGSFIGVHPNNNDTKRMRSMLEKNFRGQDVLVHATVLKGNPNSIYTNVLMEIKGLKGHPSSK